MAPNWKVSPSAKAERRTMPFPPMSRPFLLAAIVDLLKKMFELASGWTVRLASARGKLDRGATSSIVNRRGRVRELHACVVLAPPLRSAMPPLTPSIGWFGADWDLSWTAAHAAGSVLRLVLRNAEGAPRRTFQAAPGP